MYNLEAIKTELPYYQEIMLYYKINPCMVGQQKNGGESNNNRQICNQFFCFNYHNQNEKRRAIFDEETSSLAYQPIKCSYLTENKPCLNGEICKFAHTQNEINFHPIFYKTEPCQGCFFDSNSKFCPFYHSDEVSRKMILEKFKNKFMKEMSKTQQTNSPTSQNTFSLDNFKAKPCQMKGNHNPKVCEYYHHENDRKRPVSVFHYSPNMCEYAQNDQPCPNGDNCRLCHNKVEQLYHPEKYKKKFCLFHPHSIYKCEYGNFCSFAHSENEIQIELLHNLKKDEHFYLYKFKTVFCPYIYEHDRNQCVYAHNPQDYRRDPTQYQYSPVQCSYWSQRQIYSYEEGSCPKGMNCEHCHGWKELEYHPLYYKTKPCNNGKKCNKKDCPFYHQNTERRDARPNSQLTQTLLGPQNTQSFNQIKTNTMEIDQGFPFDSKKGKFGKSKESNYTRPIGLGYVPPSKGNEQQHGSYDPKKVKQLGDSSTRHTSNISSVYSPEEDQINQESKKKKGKGLSLQSKKEKSPSSISTKSDKPLAQLMKGMHIDSANIWEPSNKELKTGFDEFFSNFEFKKPVDETKADDSFESLHSLTVEKNFISSDKPTENEASNAFKKALFSKLIKNKLEFTIPHIKNANLSSETLKSFGPKDFGLLPQISTKDKEKIARIILDIQEGEAILSEINTIHEEPMGTSLPQNSGEESGIFGNFGTYDSNTDFNVNIFLQRNTY